jgi:dihydroflavonol-4-reductase
MAKTKMWVSHEKASRELGYSPAPARQALADAAAWFTRNQCEFTEPRL